MLNILRGNRPDVTPAQTIASLAAGIPIIAKLLGAFEVYTMTAVQQEALSDAVTWGGVFAGLLIGGDALVRASRNSADSKVQAAAVTQPTAPTNIAAGGGTITTAPTPVTPPVVPGESGDYSSGTLVEGGTALYRGDAEPLLVSDEDEFASPPPVSTPPIQPSQVETDET